MAILTHLNSYAKAYTGAAASVVSQPISDHLANILMWMISLTGLVIPDNVQVSVRYILVALITGLAVRCVSNTPQT